MMNGQHAALPTRNGFSLHAQFGIGKNALPALADRSQSEQANTRRMHAEGFLLFRPDLHQQIRIALNKHLIEGLFDIFRRGVGVGLAHAVIRLRLACNTISGESLLRQSK